MEIPNRHSENTVLPFPCIDLCKSLKSLIKQYRVSIHARQREPPNRASGRKKRAEKGRKKVDMRYLLLYYFQYK